MTEPGTNQTERDNLPEVLDAPAVAKVFGVCPRVAARWLATGVLPSRRVGKRRFITRAALLQALQPECPGRRRANET